MDGSLKQVFNICKDFDQLEQRIVDIRDSTLQYWVVGHILSSLQSFYRDTSAPLNGVKFQLETTVPSKNASLQPSDQETGLWEETNPVPPRESAEDATF